MTIYQITNTINGKIYIGKTVKTIEERFQNHIRHSRCESQTQTYLHNAMRKYGTEAFITTELESGFDNEDDLNEAEIRYIAELKPQYNMTAGGEGVSGFVMSEESRKKLSEAMKGKPKSEEHRRKLSDAGKGKKHLEETKRKISETTKGKKLSEETKRRMSVAKKGKKLGPLSEERKRKLREPVTCPYCQKTGGTIVMRRWHFDNCKQKRTETASN